MPSYPTIPTSGTRQAPSAGPDAGMAAILGALPALASIVPGNMGMVAQGLAGIPGMALNYQTTRDATERENANREAATTLVEGWRPYVGRPKEFDIDVRVPYAAQAVRMSQAGAEQGRRAVEDALIKYGSTYGDRLPEAQLDKIAGAIERATQNDTQNNVNALWQDATREWINNRMSVGQAELQRAGVNEQMGGERVRMLAEILTRPYGVASTQGMMDSVTEALQFAQQLDFQRDELRSRERIAERQMNYGLLGAGIQSGATLGSGAMTASAISKIGK